MGKSLSASLISSMERTEDSPPHYDATSGKELWRFYTVPGDPTKDPFENKQMEPRQRLGPALLDLISAVQGVSGRE